MFLKYFDLENNQDNFDEPHSILNNINLTSLQLYFPILVYSIPLVLSFNIAKYSPLPL